MCYVTFIIITSRTNAVEGLTYTSIVTSIALQVHKEHYTVTELNLKDILEVHSIDKNKYLLLCQFRSLHG